MSWPKQQQNIKCIPAKTSTDEPVPKEREDEEEEKEEKYEKRKTKKEKKKG